jgi:MFS family permease
MLVFLLATGLAMLFVGRAILGFAVGVVTGTATAWLAELSPGRDKARASNVASAVSLLGLGTGPLLAGVLAQYAPWPTKLAYAVELILLLLSCIVVWKARETVAARRQPVSLRPRVGVPGPLWSAFVAPAAAGFSVFAVSGLLAARCRPMVG